jgi:alpha/beta superfamily hydrolase
LEITAATQLPAHREDITLETEDGETLVGELALPLEADPVATLITLHPLPTAGGFMDSHILRKAANRLPALAQIGVLRFNTRGTGSARGRSSGSFGEGVTERYDLLAAVEFCRKRGLRNLWLVGWSFGTEVALKHGREVNPAGLILLSPPLRRASEADLLAWNQLDVPIHALVPELDDFLRPAEAVQKFSGVRTARVHSYSGQKHLWIGEPATRLVLNAIVNLVRPGFGELPVSVVADGASKPPE